MSVLDLAPRALAEVAPAVEALARAEGLLGHSRAVELRVGNPIPAATRGARRAARPPRRRRR
jgi:histidinol dehydrogenase